MEHLSEKAEVCNLSNGSNEPVQAPPPVDTGEKPKLSWQTIMAIISLITTLNGYLFTLAMPPAIIAFVNADLGPNKNYVWITISWNLAAAVLVTVSGRLADIFGRRYFLIAGAAISCVGALIGATAKNIPTMIGSGIMFGIGGGFQEMVFSCIQELVPNRYRFLVLGINEVSNLPSQFSPLIAYAFVAFSPLEWRTAYYWCFTFEAVALIMLVSFYFPPTFETKHREDHKTKIELLKELDYIGLILFTGACAILLMGINWGGSLHPWKSPAVIAPIAVAVVTFIILGCWEVYAPLRYPLLPPKLFRKWRDFTAILVVVFICGMLYYSMLLIWPRLSAALWIPSGNLIIRGTYANVTSFAVMLAGLYCLLIMPWVGHERWQLVALTCTQTAFIGGSASLSINDTGRAIAFLLLAGAAATSCSPLVFGMISLGLDDQTDIGVAVGLVSTFRLVGGAVASAIYTSIQGNEYAKVLPVQMSIAASSSQFKGSVSELTAAALNSTAAAYGSIGASSATIAAARLAIKEANVQSFSMVFKVAIAFGGLAIIGALCTKSVDVRKKSNYRAAIVENEKAGEDLDKSNV